MQEIGQYTRSGDLTIRMAEQGFFSSVTDQTRDNLRVLLIAMYEVDHVIDCAGRDKDRLSNNLLSYLAGKAVLEIPGDDAARSMRDLKMIFDSLGFDEKELFLGNIRKAFESGAKYAQTTNPTEFVRERNNEARATADLMTLISAQLREHKRYGTFLREVVIVGNLVDSFEDAKQDKADGSITIKPVQLYFKLAKSAVKHSVLAVAIHPKKIQLLSICFRWASRHVVYCTPLLRAANDTFVRWKVRSHRPHAGATPESIYSKHRVT